ncbi:TonB-dependent receptor [Tamlana sp. 62-3]|uniref:TonB-dependent receptor n=1 Tax=Neotamlana sargassicola TaxID=2883125 RepID=A0A9X1I6S9_9FLAO|nr:TonB-dependent receptor [Tamlana sargassicola]MCB4807839.1 TonB-dependent receptor [Tamlana sargassicola]
MKKVFKHKRLCPFVLKIDLKMKLTVLLVFVTLFQLQAKETYGQKTKISLNLTQVSIEQVFNEIEKQTEFKFLYNYNDTNYDKTISIKAKKEQVDAILKRILVGTNVTFKVLGKQIILKKADSNSLGALKNTKARASSSTNVVQDITISGTIVDEGGLPLPGVNIIVEGTTTGTQSDFDGEYALKAKKGAVLVFSYVGYKSQKVTVGNSSTINITLIEEAGVLDEVVVIGYGTQKKVNLTSAVQMVDMKDLENRPVKSLTEMLTASVPGLNVTINSGAPNAEPSLNIRGFTGINASAAPLVLIDGVPQDIRFVNPNDVESISVLKDAAASAIYGSRAPNGVILITTKSGKKGQGMQVNFSTTLITSSPIGLPDPQDSNLDAIHRNNRRYNSQQAPLFTDEAIERMRQYIAGEITTTNIILPNGKYGSVYEYNANNNHYETGFRQNVFNRQNNLSLSGGSEKTTYFASLGAINNQGVYNGPNDWLKRYSSLIKVNTDVTDWLSIGASSKYGRQIVNRPNIWNQGQNDGSVFNLLGFIGSLPDYDDNGSPNEFSIVPNLNGLSGGVHNTIDDLWLTGQFTLKPVKGLSIKGDYSWNVNNQLTTDTETVFGSYDADGTPKNSRRSPPVDKIEKTARNQTYHNLNLVATYKLNLKNHDFTALAGYNEELFKNNTLSAGNSLFYTQTTQSISTTYGDSPFADDTIYAWATRGYFGRLTYNYKEKYLLDFNARYDASSKYSPETRWAFFPSVSAGYNIAKENFWPLKDAVSMFKIKGSWGKLGNNSAGGNYTYLPTLGTNSQTPVLLDGGKLPYVTMPGILSSDLTWTKPRTIGFGLEIAAFNNRFTLEYDWYQKTIYDQIGIAEQYSEVLGTNPPNRNNAVSETRGWEFSTTWRDRAFNIKESPLNYSIRAGISDYIGYVVKYEGSDSGLRNQWTPGQVFGELYGWTSSGIAQNSEAFQSQALWRNGWFYPGDILYADTNGDGLVNDGQGGYWYAQGDRKLLGHNYARYRYNIALNASWKGFSISALFEGVGKHTKYSRQKFSYGDRNFSSVQNQERGYWSLNNQDAYYPRAYHTNINNDYLRLSNDQYALNLAHLRIKNVNLSYSLPSEVLSRIGLRNLSINVSGENLGMVFNKSRIKEYDPIQIANDFLTYPPSRIFSLGVNVGI